MYSHALYMYVVEQHLAHCMCSMYTHVLIGSVAIESAVCSLHCTLAMLQGVCNLKPHKYCNLSMRLNEAMYMYVS